VTALLRSRALLLINACTRARVRGPLCSATQVLRAYAAPAYEQRFAPVLLQAVYLKRPLDVPAAAASLAQHATLTPLRVWDVALDSEPALDTFRRQLGHRTVAASAHGQE